MENNKTLSEAVINYVIETNKQLYDFNIKLVKDYAEFSRTAVKMIPGLEAWAPLVPVSTKK